MRIPDNKIGEFAEQRVKLAEELAKIVKDHPTLRGVVAICCDVNDRYLETRVRVLQPMLRAGNRLLAGRQGCL